MLDSIIAQLGTLPLGVLYCIAAVIAAFENVFPPFPSDLIVAFTVFISARVGGPFWAAASAVTIGNALGGMLMYVVGRRYGSLLLLEKLERYVGKSAGDRLTKLHAKYGVAALFISRFLPGVRALVPPFAGAMKIPPLQVALALTVASAVWYTFIAYVAYQAGENWPLVVRRVTESTTALGVAAAVVVAIVFAVIYIRRSLQKKRSASHDHP